MNPWALERASDPPKSAALRLDVSTTSGAVGVRREHLRQVEAVRVGKQDVEQNDVGAPFAHRRQRRRSVTDLVDDREARRLQQLPGEAAEAWMIVDDEHR